MQKTRPEIMSQAVFDNIQLLLFRCEGCPLVRECEHDNDNIEARYCWMIVDAAILGHNEFEQPKADCRKARSIRHETIEKCEKVISDAIAGLANGPYSEDFQDLIAGALESCKAGVRALAKEDEVV